MLTIGSYWLDKLLSVLLGHLQCLHILQLEHYFSPIYVNGKMSWNLYLFTVINMGKHHLTKVYCCVLDGKGKIEFCSSLLASLWYDNFWMNFFFTFTDKSMMFFKNYIERNIKSFKKLQFTLNLLPQLRKTY